MMPFPQDFFNAALGNTGVAQVLLEAVGSTLTLAEVGGYILLSYLLLRTTVGALVHFEGRRGDVLVYMKRSLESVTNFVTIASFCGLMGVLAGFVNVVTDGALQDTFACVTADLPAVLASPSSPWFLPSYALPLSVLTFTSIPFFWYAAERYGRVATLVYVVALVGAEVRAWLVLSWRPSLEVVTGVSRSEF